MAAVINTLREEHRNIARLLDVLDHQIGVFAEGGKPDYDIITGIAEYFLDYPDLCHHPKEDIVFARLSEAYPTATVTVGDLLAEHKTLHDRVVRFRFTVNALLGETDIARSAIVGAAYFFIEAERRHMQAEEKLFFPLAEQLLTPLDWSLIEGKLADGRETLFGERVDERFKNVRERLLAWESEYRTG